MGFGDGQRSFWSLKQFLNPSNRKAMAIMCCNMYASLVKEEATEIN
jgi:hypothetical protein